LTRTVSNPLVISYADLLIFSQIRDEIHTHKFVDYREYPNLKATFENCLKNSAVKDWSDKHGGAGESL